ARVAAILAAHGAHAGATRANLRGPLYRLAIRGALATGAAHVHYLDFDRALRWAARAPRELRAVLRLGARQRVLLLGRTPKAHRSHHLPLYATEVLVNRLMAVRVARARPLGVVLALLDHLEVAGGDLLGLRDGEPEALEDAHLRSPHRERRVADHHGRELAGALHETRVRHHLGHEPHLVGALGAQALAAAEQRHAEADGDRHAARHVHHLVRGDVAERDVRIDEGGLVRGDRDVRLGHQVEREAGHHAVHGRDHGLVHQLAARRGQLADALDHGELAPAVGPGAAARGERLDVGAAG